MFYCTAVELHLSIQHWSRQNVEVCDDGNLGKVLLTEVEERVRRLVNNIPELLYY